MFPKFYCLFSNTFWDVDVNAKKKKKRYATEVKKNIKILHVQEHESLRIYRGESKARIEIIHVLKHTHTQKPNPFLVLTYSTFDSTMKKRDTVKATADASNSDGETKENTEKTENGDETIAPEDSKATDSQPENADIAEENGTADKSTEDVNDEEKEATADDGEAAKKPTNGKKSSSEKRSSPRKFIRLTCVHCRTKSVKFQVNF